MTSVLTYTESHSQVSYSTAGHSSARDNEAWALGGRGEFRIKAPTLQFGSCCLLAKSMSIKISIASALAVMTFCVALSLFQDIQMVTRRKC